MLFISRLKLKNFKSFKALDVTFPQTYLCVAGPNGSGKSNILDAIRFVLGETSLKSLRARAVRDLIHSGSKSAEVVLTLDGDERIEILRAIREDGKILYRLNGEKTTRTSILNSLKRYNIDESGRNVIAQGEVQRIIQMSGKERRQIIDSVAGISDFDEKKKEALRELETVDMRIKEGTLVLGERKAFLLELEKEREAALAYQDAKKGLSTARASLLKGEVARMERELSEILATESRMTSEHASHSKALHDVDAEISSIDKKRLAISTDLQTKQQSHGFIRKIEEYKAAITSRRAALLEKHESIKRQRTLKEESEKSKESVLKLLAALEKERTVLSQELTHLEAIVKKEELAAPQEGSLEGLTRKIDGLKEALGTLKQDSVRLETEKKSKYDIKGIKEAQLESLDSQDTPDATVNAALKSIPAMKGRTQDITKEIEESFKKTKELNKDIADIDRRMLELKERASILRVSVNPGMVNPALRFVNELRSKGEQGILGTVADLISFDKKYTPAIEAAAGGRLLYVVVTDSSVATHLIDLLKRARAGRLTFIPLAEIKTPARPQPLSTHRPLLEYIEVKGIAQRAVDYVFGDTILVQELGDARKLLGQARMVTLEGELFERSGLITGGKVESSILAAKELSSLDGELGDLKAQKESCISQLYAIRESESELRQEKSDVELKIKTIEMEHRHILERSQERSKALEKRDELKTDLAMIDKEIQTIDSELAKLVRTIAHKESEIAALQKSFEDESTLLKDKLDQVQKANLERAARVSELRATLQGKDNEITIRKTEKSNLDATIETSVKETKQAYDQIESIGSALANDEESLKKTEGEASQFSKELESLLATLRKYEKELQEFALKRGEKVVALEKINKQLNDLLIKKATVSTRHDDVKAEFASFAEIPTIEAPRDQLLAMIKESEQKLKDLGSVNLMAIDMYGKKKEEIEETEGKIAKLSSERDAVFLLISEIEDRKRGAFFETFYAVSDNFKKMFENLPLGEGILYLDKPEDPFESGLLIKLKRYGKEHSINALSGGENTILAVMFIFALQFFKPSPFYILDEVDAALDKENSKNLSKLISDIATKHVQFIIVTHNDTMMSNAASVFGVTKVSGVSKLVGVKLEALAGRPSS